MLNYTYTTLNWGPHASSAQVSLRRPGTAQVSLSPTPFDTVPDAVWTSTRKYREISDTSILRSYLEI